MVPLAALVLFIVAFIAITFEERLRTNRSAIALTLAGILWIFVVFSGRSREAITQVATIAGNEILGIIMFLLTSMVLVEIMAQHHLFDFIRDKLLLLKIDIHKQFILLSMVAFFASATLDNMTIGLVMIQVARQFFRGKNLLIAAAGIIIGANAGGSWSPIGDVTTVLLWLSGKYHTFSIIHQGFFPALAFMIVALMFLGMQIHSEEHVEHENTSFGKLSKTDIGIILGALVSFILPIYANIFGLPPYIGLLFGLGLIWLFIKFIDRGQQDIMPGVFRKVDLASINFYTGILLAANALNALGILHILANVLFGPTEKFFRVVWSTIIAGFVFGAFDNIPLTALAIKLIPIHQETFWILLALAVGNGGSIFLIGSAAGIAVMSGIKELTVTKYFRIAFLPTTLAYITMIAVWLGQYFLFLK